MKTLLLVDLSGLYRAHWHASVDQELSAAYEKTIAGVQRVVAGYDHVAICIDRPPYKRRELLPSYKAQREAPPAQMVEQFRRVKERLEADGYLLWGAQGFEADDIIATAVRAAAKCSLDVMIASSDKDLMQLIVDRDEADDVPGVRQMSWATGQVFDSKAVFEKFAVPPALMADLLALTGDSSDNIPGVAGVGPKTAAALLKQFGSFEDVITFADQIKQPKLRESVLRDGVAAKLARQLVALDSNAPIQFTDLFEKREPKPLSEVIDVQFDEASEPSNEKPSDPPPAPEPRQGDAGPKVASATPRPTAAPASTALVVRPEPPKEWALQLEPGTTEDAWKMSKVLHNSRLFTQFGTAEAIFAVLLRGRSLGIDAVTSLSNFHVIEGKPTMHASLIVGLILKSGKADYFDLAETSNERAVWITRRKGSTREVEMVWTVADALNAGLLVGTPDDARGVSKSGKPSNWDKYRRTMLRWRGAVELARAVYPDVTTGLYTPDEVSDGVYDPAIEERHVA